ncbi:unnamed protein product [Vicia faba]|uniref:Uncharacterized protein n=1 Tax=Vicia faba TaxID=3906 RepID=A0AAV0YDD1_VICFA|nr:unnamed protein product [Vicia faba]
MAKNNKYASINFNHIYDKSITTTTKTTNASKSPSISSSSSSFSSASYSAVSAPNKHGRILVLTRPTPKPIAHHPTPSAPPSKPNPNPNPNPNPILQGPDRPRSEPGSDSISLRPLGRTGVASSPLLPTPNLNQGKEKDLGSLKPNKFVPPHLRPGFVPREEHARPELGRFRENLRPKSGGNERMRRIGVSDSSFKHRPSSSG